MHDEDLKTWNVLLPALIFFKRNENTYLDFRKFAKKNMQRMTEGGGDGSFDSLLISI